MPTERWDPRQRATRIRRCDRRAIALAVAGASLACLMVLALPRGDRAAPAAAERVPPAEARSVELAEREPNDQPAQAQRLGGGPLVVVGRLRAGDRDVFRIPIEAPGGHTLSAMLAEGPAGTHLDVERDDGTRLARVTAPDRIAALGGVQGQAFVLALSGAEGPYRLVVALSPWRRGLDWEPDDDADSAQDLMRTEPEGAQTEGSRETAILRAQGFWSHAGDVDCYALPERVPARAEHLRIELEPPREVAGKLWVLDARDPEPRRPVMEAESVVRGGVAVIPTLSTRTDKSRYVICTRAAEGRDGGQVYRLRVRVSVPKETAEREPNGSRKEASLLPIGQDLHGFLTTGDVDWFRVASGTSRVRVRLTPPMGVSAALVVLDETGFVIDRALARDGQEATVTGKGLAFLQVLAASGGSTASTYTLRAEVLDGRPRPHLGPDDPPAPPR